MTASPTVIMAAPPPPSPSTSQPSTSQPPASSVADVPWISRHRPRRNLVELGVGVGALLPSADHELYRYDTMWRRYAPAAANLAVRAGFYPLGLLGVEAEAALAPTRTDVGDAARLFGVRGHVVAQLPLYSVVPFVLVGGGILGAGGALGLDVDPSLHFGGGLKIFATRWIGGRIDARTHLGLAHTREASRTFHTEFLASLVVTLHRPYLDTDRDGVPDPGQRSRSEDACPRDRGVKALRGCPDADSDGIRDLDDRCPGQPGLAPRDGCPALVDSDGDGFYDPGQYAIPAGRTDTCDGETGVKEYSGCPAPDSDGDGLNDLLDRCPEPENINGFEDEDGCPDQLPRDVAAILGTISGVQFAFLSDRLSEASKPTLRKAADVLAAHPDLRLEIQGHTDVDGDAAVNKTLSLRRAMAVRAELIAHGVAEDRVRAIGYGGERPLDDNQTEQGRAANRRIELRLLDAEGRPLAVAGEPGARP